ncbi:MAG: HAD family phosphatase [Clostridia bacterium]|nr:HAD family phosphatase [Clostridia bacterium]
MEDIRLIATDVDGTILPHGGKISEATRRAVRRCRAAGIPFVIASGRWIGALEDIVCAVGAEDQPLIVANGGAVVAPDGAILHEWTMDERDAWDAYGVLRKYDVMIVSYVRDAAYRLNTAAMPQLPGGYMGKRDYRAVDDDVNAFEAEGLRGVYKLEAITEDRNVIARLRTELLEKTRAVITGAFWRNTEIQSPGMGKGTALRWLADSLGIPAGNCMAFGDNTNDVDMLEAVGWPVAMANGAERAKAAARIVAPADVGDGVAQTIFKYVFGEKLS